MVARLFMKAMEDCSSPRKINEKQDARQFLKYINMCMLMEKSDKGAP